ncbi:MAG: hypothetical protein NO516_03450, partial [Candidatus Methanomethylicia archaeon]|nr:hypothetical protein [Candidatus Methanomethylicia archaeon]
VIKKHRMVSPRVVAEVIKEANRLRSQEVALAMEFTKPGLSPEKLEELKLLYKEDFSRLKDLMGSTDLETLKAITPENYKIRLYHFDKAAQQLEGEMEKEIMDAQESLVSEGLEHGVMLGLATDQQGRRGVILIVECSVKPGGTGKVTVTGAAKAALLGGASAVEDTSVIESATNVVEFIKHFIYENLKLDISRYDFTYQVISPLEGMAGMGVSGPSLGLAFSLATISELTKHPCKVPTVMSGKGDIKGNVGPVGGLGWRGSGKIIAAVQTRRIKVKKFAMPKWNFDNSGDEISILKSAGIEVLPVERQVDAWLDILGMSQEELLRRLETSLKHES